MSSTHAPPGYPRVFIGLREVAGYFGNLKKGFEKLGVESTFVNLAGHGFAYAESGNPLWARRINGASQRIGKYFKRGWLRRIIWVGLIQNLIGPFVLLWAIPRSDVFIFASVSTFFFFLELPLLKLLKKRIIFVFIGSDTRPVYLNGYVISNTRFKTMAVGILLARVQQIIVRIVETFADEIVNIPPQSHFHSRPIISGFRIGLPVACHEEILPIPAPRDVVRILHAPSKPDPKGTPLIRSVIERLKQRGLKIEYRELTGRPNSEVIEAIKNCDFIVDEVYSDTPMAVFASEAAAWGKPAVVGSYYYERIRAELAPPHIPPSEFCHPSNLEASIEKLVTNADYRQALGVRARAFAETEWRMEKVAERFICLARGKAPQAWYFDPNTIDYVHGCGLEESKARALIQGFVKVGGKRSLCLPDKGELERLLVMFSKGEAV